MPLVLRAAKGSALSYSELDGNFSYLDNKIAALDTKYTGSSRTVTANTTATATDVNGVITANSATAINITIPNDATGGWSSNEFLTAWQKGAGAVNFVAGSGVTLRVPASLVDSEQYGTKGAYRVGPNEWALL